MPVEIKSPGWWNHRIFSPARFLYHSLLDFVYPPVCWGCHLSLASDEFVLCHRCVDALPYLPQPTLPSSSLSWLKLEKIFFDRSLAVYKYSALVQELVHQFKYNGITLLAPLFGEAIASAFFRSGGQIEALVPVPLHRSRLRERGYNQSLLLAQQIGKAIGAPVIEERLVRVKNTISQATLSRQERMANVTNAFQLKQPELFRGKSIGLVDDVFTTGSTMNECARLLKDAGATSVMCISIVRV
jgi:competence protein ComFC